ncbi:MAG: murein L,D-transpeptidase [Desulfobacterales bacterium]
MKKSAIIFLFVIAIVIPAVSEAQNIPSSARSRAAISRVKPKLQREFSRAGFNWAAPIFIRIFKKTKELEIWLKDRKNFRLFKTYKICTYGWRGLGPKIRQGDGRAPEGFYYVLPRQMNPHSEFHLSFNLGYPNAYDRVHGRTGSALMVHGSCVSIGCYAMTDKGIEEIFTLADASLRNGQRFFRVHIFPFRMTDKNMNKYKDSEWYKFWKNLKEGYDFFEKNGHNPPNVEVKNKRYVFEPS